MHGIRDIREQEEDYRRRLRRRGAEDLLDPALELDRERRRLLTEAEALKKERNKKSREIGARRKAGEDTTEQQADVRAVGQRIAEMDAHAREKSEALNDALLRIPNVPRDEVPDGGGPEDNVVVREVGERRTFEFDPEPHWDVGDRLGLFDFDRAARMTGAGFPLLRGMGARLQRGLCQFMLDLHVNEHGYTEIAPPYLCHRASMTGTGQLPKMEDDMYRIPDDGLYLIPTAEVPLTNLYREEIIRDPLPIRLTACTPCFRREAGAAGRETRGLNRVHQFDKVEMVRIVEPETSPAELETLREHAETVLRRLGLPYRVIELCTGDLSFAAARCYDLELWAPGQQMWLEVSSCSNFGAFQARRCGMRYRNADGAVAHPHTLNGSGVALPRLLAALLENGQQSDGSVVLPEALAPYMEGKTRLVP